MVSKAYNRKRKPLPESVRRMVLLELKKNSNGARVFEILRNRGSCVRYEDILNIADEENIQLLKPGLPPEKQKALTSALADFRNAKAAAEAAQVSHPTALKYARDGKLPLGRRRRKRHADCGPK